MNFVRSPGTSGTLAASTAVHATGAVTWSLAVSPAGSNITINPSTGVVSTASLGAEGKYAVTVTGQDSATPTPHVASWSFSIESALFISPNGLQNTLFVNGVNVGTSATNATKSVTSPVNLTAVGNTMEIVYASPHTVAASEIILTATSFPTSMTYDQSFSNDGVNYVSCGTTTMSGSSVTVQGACTAAQNPLGSHWRLTVTAISGTLVGGAITTNGFYDN